MLAATSPEITEMGWYFVGLVMWGTTLMLLVGLVINNIQRQFPMYWWTNLPLRETVRDDVEVGEDGNGGFEEGEKKDEAVDDEEVHEICISATGVVMPKDFALNGQEAELLEQLRNRLEKRRAASSERSPSTVSSTNMTMVASR